MNKRRFVLMPRVLAGGLMVVAGLLFPLHHTYAQQAPLSLDSAVAAGLRASPAARQAGELTREQAALRRAAFSLPNPGIIVESPTGDFYTVGAQQTFEFPTVYTRQARLARTQVSLAEQNSVATRNAVKRDVRLAYLDLEVTEARLRQLQAQDSLLRLLAAASERLYAAGEVNALQRVSTQAEARQATNRVRQAEADRTAAQRRLGLLLGRSEAASRLVTDTDLTQPAATSLADTLRLVGLDNDTAAIAHNPELAVADHTARVSELSRRVTRARALPGFTIGYLNQGPRETPIGTRLQGGITLPLYFWQYRAQNRAAEARLRAAQAGRAAVSLNVRTELTQASADVRKYAASLRYYTLTGLPQAATITTTAQRLFGAGNVSYYLLVQSLQQAAQIRAEYLEAVRGYRQALIQLDFLQGQ